MMPKVKANTKLIFIKFFTKFFKLITAKLIMLNSMKRMKIYDKRVYPIIKKPQKSPTWKFHGLIYFISILKCIRNKSIKQLFRCFSDQIFPWPKSFF